MSSTAENHVLFKKHHLTLDDLRQQVTLWPGSLNTQSPGLQAWEGKMPQWITGNDAIMTFPISTPALLPSCILTTGAACCVMIVDLQCILEAGAHSLEGISPNWCFLCTFNRQFHFSVGCKILGGMVWEKSIGSHGLVSIDTLRLL